MSAVGYTDTHECFFRGCEEIVTGKYHCERHEAILQRQRTRREWRGEKATYQVRGLLIISLLALLPWPMPPTRVIEPPTCGYPYPSICG